MADAAVMDTPNGYRKDSGFSELLFADSRTESPALADDSFLLRGREDNRLIDAANPLLGLVVRVRRLAHFQRVPALYQQVVDEIADIDRELVEQGYERPTVVAYRYVLCAFIDEAVLGTDWGAHSVWSQQSLLSRFHNETWGGEKVFAILSRMEQEPSRYRDMLEFIYLCLCLGFEGRYKVMTNGRDEYDQVVRGLYDQLKALAGGEAAPLSQPLENVAPARNRIRRGLPLWVMAGLFAAAMAGVYHLYNMALNERIKDVLSVLEQLPK
ncbi:type IVB secretion system protein IcmH/DotU [Marinobacter mobilis]|uniref:type IVB secretion system protein IcmH/DotU n=1 Tax=Marinobacter mobilis TaxID=488533 RepID=UPI0035C71BAC